MPFALIYPASFNFLMVSARVAGVPILNPLKMAIIICSSSFSSYFFPQVSITLRSVFSVCGFGGFRSTSLISDFIRGRTSPFFTAGRIVSLASIPSINFQPASSCTFPFATNSPGISVFCIFMWSTVSSATAIGINCAKNLFFTASYTIRSDSFKLPGCM